MCRIWWESEFLVEDFLRFTDLARAPRPAASLQRATGGRPARSRRYRVVHDALGYSDELRAALRTDRAVWGFVSLWRAEGEPPFSSAEEKLLADLSAPIAQPFRRAVLLSDPLAAEEGIEAPGLLTFDASGRLESLNEQAETWLAQLPRPAVQCRSDRAFLPPEVLTVSTRARAIAAGPDGGLALARIRTQSGRWLVVHGFALRSADGPTDRTALVIQPARASKLAPIVLDAYELTRRERQISHLVSYGLSTGEIAARLGLSPHTVRDYLKRIFEKVGVSSRGELVGRIYAEHYGPRLDASILEGLAGDATA